MLLQQQMTPWHHSRQSGGNTSKTKNKNKPTNVGRKTLERQAGGKTFNPTGIRNVDLPTQDHMHFPLGYRALILAMPQPILY